MAKNMDTVSFTSQMEVLTVAIFGKVQPKVRAGSCIQTEMFTLGSGKMTKHTAMVSTTPSVAVNIKDSGNSTCEKATDCNSLKMALGFKANTTKTKSKAKESFIGPMATFMRVISTIINARVRAL